MNKCLNCGKDVKNKYCNVSCQNKHQGNERANKKYGKLKLFDVKCKNCGKVFQVKEREKLFPKKEHYFCSRTCANRRNITDEIKEKIRISLLITNNEKKKNNEKIIWKHIDIKTYKCKNCGKYFVYKKKKQIFCSRSCNTIYHNMNSNRCSNGGRIIDIKKNNSSAITYIYALEYPKNNIRYVGKSNDPEKRLKRHISDSKKRKTHKDKWIQSLTEKPYLRILEKVKYYEWQEKEKYWIDFYSDNNLVNGTSGGEGSDGFKGKHHTEETKELLRQISLNRKKKK